MLIFSTRLRPRRWMLSEAPMHDFRTCFNTFQVSADEFIHLFSGSPQIPLEPGKEGQEKRAE